MIQPSDPELIHQIQAGNPAAFEELFARYRPAMQAHIARILPDDQMPHLADGIPVELLYSFMGVPLRMNFGQIREALLGRIAHLEGEPIFCPPYAAPDSTQIKSRLQRVNLSPDGMETLKLGAMAPGCNDAAW